MLAYLSWRILCPCGGLPFDPRRTLAAAVCRPSRPQRRRRGRAKKVFDENILGHQEGSKVFYSSLTLPSSQKKAPCPGSEDRAKAANQSGASFIGLSFDLIC